MRPLSSAVNSRFPRLATYATSFSVTFIGSCSCGHGRLGPTIPANSTLLFQHSNFSRENGGWSREIYSYGDACKISQKDPGSRGVGKDSSIMIPSILCLLPLFQMPFLQTSPPRPFRNGSKINDRSTPLTSWKVTGCSVSLESPQGF